ncbi:hypothetical protein [Pseudoalteromonas nigrifaciens]|uniref:hypothetical protein n=1 Tax=Pseudoalteromonas nigrifaciens TaxID=28109 RepID=UPI003F9AEF86
MPNNTGSNGLASAKDLSSLGELWEKVQEAPWYAPLIIPAMWVIYKLYSRRKTHILEMAKLSTEKHKNILNYKLKMKELEQKAETRVQSNGGNQ